MFLNNFFTIRQFMDNMTGSGTETRWADFVNSHPIYNTSGSALAPTYYTGYYHVKPFSIISNANTELTATASDVSTFSGVIGRAEMVFGSGSTPVTHSDYTLSGDQIMTLTPIMSTYIHSVTQNQFVRLVQNQTASAITVSEVGIVIRLGGIDSSIISYPILAFREVLPTPVVIQPNETKVFSIDLR